MMKLNKNVLLIGLGSLLLAGCGDSSRSSGRLPNVIYVFPDQMRNHAMGFWSQPDFRGVLKTQGDPVHTPNLDRFARESVVLTSAMSNAPVSSPHRGCLMTGMFPEHSGVPMNCCAARPVCSLRRDVTCMSDVFSASGYNCAYIGKYHLDYPTPNDPEHPGQYVGNNPNTWDAYTPPERRHHFDYWYSYGTFDVHKHPHYWDTEGKRHDINEWSPLHEAEKVIAYIRNEGNVRDTRKPFFMMVAFNPPHTPYHSLEDCMEEDYNLYKGLPLDSLLVRPNADKNMKKSPHVRYYFASVTGVDRAFGKILEELKRSGLDKNTIVVFSSDHGETMCSHTEKPKNVVYAESMNVPFIVRFPGRITPHVEQELLLSSPDIMPTLLGLCGLDKKIPSEVEGRNYAGRLTGEDLSVPLRDGALYIVNGGGEKNAEGKIISYFPSKRGIKTHRYTMSLTIDMDKQLKDVILFDDIADPYQMNNLPWQENKEIVADLCRRMVPLLKEACDPWYREKILKELIPYDN